MMDLMSAASSTDRPVLMTSRLYFLEDSSNRSSGSGDPCAAFRIALNTGAIGTLCLLGLAGNTLSIVILRTDRYNRVAVFLLQALAIADNAVLLVSGFMLSIVYGVLSDRTALVARAMPYIGRYVSPVGYMAQCVAIWMTVLLAINRYVAVCRPFHASSCLSMRKSQIQVAVVVVFSVLFNIPRIFQYQIEYITHSGAFQANETEIVIRKSEFGAHYLFEVYASGVYTILILILPLVLMVGLNVRLVHELHAAKRRMLKFSVSNTGQYDDNITVVMVVIVVVLVVCQTPEQINRVLRWLARPLATRITCQQPFYYIQSISNLLIVLNSSTNFVIYYVFRIRFRQMVLKKVCRRTIPTRRCTSVQLPMRYVSRNPLRTLSATYETRTQTTFAELRHAQSDIIPLHAL